jgi:hypothetical protein
VHVPRITPKAVWPADKMERWPVERLIPYARNARTHSAAQVDQIAASIRQWGCEMTDQELMDRIFELQEEAGLAPMKTIPADSRDACSSAAPVGSTPRLACPARSGPSCGSAARD